MHNITFVHMNDKLREQYYDYIDEYNTHQQEAERPALPRLPRNKQSNVMGNESPTNHQTQKKILHMNKTKIVRGFFHCISAYMIINLGIFILWLLTVALFDLNGPKFTDKEILILQWGQVLIVLMSVLWASEELEREGYD